MLLLRLKEGTGVPVYKQIIAEIRRKIENGTLKTGEILPSTRSLAAKLDVHRSTVALAYQELWALGFLDLRPGARPRVRERMSVATLADRTGLRLIDWAKAASPAANGVLEAYARRQALPLRSTGSRIIDFSRLDMDSRLYPLSAFRSCLNRVFRDRGEDLMGYGPRAGWPDLRETVARRLQSHGVSASADEILITNGSQQALDLVLRMIAAPGRAVAIESPTYSHVLPLLRLHGLGAVDIPMRSDGMDLDVLEARLRSGRVSLIYTMPNFHNPTGVSTGQVHRERLLQIAERARVPVLEDGYEEEMKYFGRVVLPVKSMDRHGVVIYCGTFSKVLFPGLRVGWIATEPACIERLLAIRVFSELAIGQVLQAAMDEFCRSGGYDRHISRMHRVFRKRMQTALRALKTHIPSDWAEWEEPTGGYLIWLKLNRSAAAPADWAERLAAHGLRASAGRDFFFRPDRAPFLRLSISTLNDAEITEGVRRLTAALGSVYRRREGRS